jgi:hypothetical protein
VLLKEGPLDEAELALVREHTHIGASLLAGSDSEVIQMGATIALRHHERWDGTGYPDGIAGEDIPLEARICTVVDYYDSSTMHRPYRRAFPEEQVVEDMKGSRVATSIRRFWRRSWSRCRRSGRCGVTIRLPSIQRAGATSPTGAGVCAPPAFVERTRRPPAGLLASVLGGATMF